MRGRLTRLTVYSASHFLVDFGCALLIFRTVSASGDPTVLFILYNYCAFALQMPVGLLADKLNRNALMAAAGCALVALGCAFSAVPLAAAAISGVGNALFHVGGGVDVLDDSEGKASSLGVFVSPGAAGLFLGTMLGKGGASLWIVNAAMALAAFSILLTAKKTDCLVSHNAPVSFKGMRKFDVLLPALCLFFVVIIRSFAGMTMGFAWKGEGYWGVAALAAVVLGKTAGGFAMGQHRRAARGAALADGGGRAVLVCRFTLRRRCGDLPVQHVDADDAVRAGAADAGLQGLFLRAADVCAVSRISPGGAWRGFVQPELAAGLALCAERPADAARPGRPQRFSVP